jgi:hypothetical protein
MPSPFPGMDPYLEDPDEWPDVHGRLITYIADQLQPLVHPSYRTRINRREYVMRDDRSIYPDIAITGRHLRESALDLTIAVPAAMAGVPAVPPFHEPLSPPPRSVDIPFRVRVPLISQREPFLEIVHRESHEIVTAIELLSPTNKHKGKGHQQYRRKQREVLASEANLVEIDLLGTGAHTVAVPADRLTALPPHRYRICVSRAADRKVFEVYAMVLSDRCGQGNRIKVSRPPLLDSTDHEAIHGSGLAVIDPGEPTMYNPRPCVPPPAIRASGWGWRSASPRSTSPCAASTGRRCSPALRRRTMSG